MPESAKKFVVPKPAPSGTGFILPDIPPPPKVIIQPRRKREAKVAEKTPENPMGFDFSDEDADPAQTG